MSRFAEESGKLADDAHEPVLYLLPKQNRELSYASSIRASRVKISVRSWYLKS
jgi:hypothetical protein